MTHPRLAALALLATAVAAHSAAAGRPSERAVTALVDRVEAEPHNPDLAWALIGALEARGERERAVARLEEFVRRWPDRRPQAWPRLGRLRYELGRHAEALEAIAAGSERRPLDGAAQLYRGLALRALGRDRESERALLAAGRLDPGLEAETLLLRAVGSLDRGDTERGRALLREALAVKPSGPTARECRLLLGAAERDARAEARLTLSAYAGVETDSNVTLEGEQALGARSDASDARAVWGADLAYRALETETGSLTAGYRYAGSGQDELDRYDAQRHAVFGSAELNPWDRVQLRLDGVATDHHLDRQRYLRSRTARLNLLYTLGARAGLSRMYFEVERSDYHDPAPLPSLERGGDLHAAGFEHYAPLPGRRDAWASLGVRLERIDTEASRDRLGFDGAYDRRRAAISLRAHVAAGWGLDADLSATLARERFLHRNVIDGLFSSPSLAQAERRRDRDFATTFALSRELTELARVELRYRGARERSNVPLYSYDRHIVGLYVRVRTF